MRRQAILLILTVFAIAAVLIFGCSSDESTSSDTTPPTIRSSSPADGMVDVPLESQIVIRFSEAMARASANEGRIYFTPDVLGSWVVMRDSMVFTPLSDLVPSTLYEVHVTTRVQDAAANRLETPTTWSFRTINAPPPPPIRQRMMFTRHFYNPVDTFIQYGWLIDSSGQVYTYQFAETDDPNLADILLDKTVEAAELSALLAKTERGYDSIPESTLRQMFFLIEPADLGPYSDTSAVTATFGQLVTSAFLFDTLTSQYQQVELEVQGDTAFSNESPAAQALHPLVVRYCDSIDIQ